MLCMKIFVTHYKCNLSRILPTVYGSGKGRSQNVMSNSDFHLLRFMMSHFLQLCQLQVSRGIMEPPTLLIQSFCHVLLRPPWEKIV